MLLDLVQLLIGTLALLGGAYILLRGAVGLAVRFGISRVVIGATIVAFGTSLPELLVTVTAEIRGSSGVGLGNVLGSNVANVFLVLGMAALINPMSVHRRLIRWEIPVLFAATLVTVLLAANGLLSRLGGALMFAGLVAFTVVSVRLFPEAAHEAEDEVEIPADAAPGGVMTEVAFVVAGLAALALGADQIVNGATGIAERVGVSEFVIGVLVVAVGTSLPEIATSAVAAFRNEHDIAVANVVGSNIFNLLSVLGLGALIAEIPVDGALYRFEIPAVILSTAILVPLVWPRYHVGRGGGALLLAGYAAFVAVTLLRGTG